MNFLIVDDDPAVRFMLAQIIEDEDLGQVVGEADDGADIDIETLKLKQVDILFIDLLMPNRDGIETVRAVLPQYKGKIITLSHVDSKDIIGSVYSLGIEYYVRKPINRLEIIAVIRKVTERMKLQKSLQDMEKSIQAIKKSIDFLAADAVTDRQEQLIGTNILTSGNYLLTELGMTGESGTHDLLDMLEYLHLYDLEQTLKQGFPPLKGIFYQIAVRKLGPSTDSHHIQKEIKAAEQRVRRAIIHALNHMASIGLTDYSNSKFENYASKFFDFVDVRRRMLEIGDGAASNAPNKVNTKKFIHVLYLEAKLLKGHLTN